MPRDCRTGQWGNRPFSRLRSTETTAPFRDTNRHGSPTSATERMTAPHFEEKEIRCVRDRNRKGAEISTNRYRSAGVDSSAWRHRWVVSPDRARRSPYRCWRAHASSSLRVAAPSAGKVSGTVSCVSACLQAALCSGRESAEPAQGQFGRFWIAIQGVENRLVA